MSVYSVLQKRIVAVTCAQLFGSLLDNVIIIIIITAVTIYTTLRNENIPPEVLKRKRWTAIEVGGTTTCGPTSRYVCVCVCVNNRAERKFSVWKREERLRAKHDKKNCKKSLSERRACLRGTYCQGRPWVFYAALRDS